MSFERKNLLLYAVGGANGTEKNKFFADLESALKGGITCFQLREKHLPFDEFLAEAKEVKKLCAKYSVPLIINDNIEIALSSGADGVHVGQDDMNIVEARKIAGKKLVIGVSAHNVEEALLAEKNGADYLGSGAVFGSQTKSNVHTLPLETLKNICSSVKIPVVAIGGINKDNISRLSGSGISGVALVSAVFGVTDIENECIMLKKLAEKVVKG
ncbi:thiamine phosphate synthase [bacterium]|nr:thiamine phosphate synthase [bacterium]